MVNLIRCKTKQDSVRKNLVRPVPAGYPGRSLEAVGNDSSREMVIAPQGVQNPAYNYSTLKALANRGSLLLFRQGKSSANSQTHELAHARESDCKANNHRNSQHNQRHK